MNYATQAAALLPAVKNYLDITWTDEAGDAKLTGILARGMAYLDRLAGLPLPYDEENTARALLFDYVRYVRADAMEDFQHAFIADLTALQIEWRGNHDAKNNANV